MNDAHLSIRSKQTIVGLKSRLHFGGHELDPYLRDSARQIDTARKDLVAALRGQRIEVTLGAVGIAIPLVVGALVGGLPAIAATSA